MDIYLVIPTDNTARYVVATDQAAAQTKAEKTFGEHVVVKRFGEIVGSYVVPTCSPIPLDSFPLY